MCRGSHEPDTVADDKKWLWYGYFSILMSSLPFIVCIQTNKQIDRHQSTHHVTTSIEIQLQRSPNMRNPNSLSNNKLSVMFFDFTSIDSERSRYFRKEGTIISGIGEVEGIFSRMTREGTHTASWSEVLCNLELQNPESRTEGRKTGDSDRPLALALYRLGMACEL